MSLNEHGADKYVGEVATGYDAKREDTPKRIAEERIIKDMLSDLPAGSWVLDCPVGTGFLLPYYIERGFQVWALDKSEDMLAQAWNKVRHPNIRYYVADVRDLKQSGNKSVDAALSIRITRWLSPEDCQQMMRELQRVARRKIIITLREWHHVPGIARPLEIFEAALDGWKVHRNEAGYEEAYRIIEFRPEVA